MNIIGRELDVPVVNLGFSGCGLMKFEMSEHISRIDASCYVLDCLGNMNMGIPGEKKGRSVADNYEPFIRKLYEKLVKEGWKNLHYLPKDGQFADDLEGTVEGLHPNDWGMMSKAKAFGKAVSDALSLECLR